MWTTAVLGAQLDAFESIMESFLLSLERSTFVPLTTVPALAYIRTYKHTLTHTHTANEMTSRKQRCLRSLAQYFSPIKYGIQNNAELWWKKLDFFYDDVRSLSLSSRSPRPRNIENLFHLMHKHQKLKTAGAKSRQKTLKFSPICHCACISRYFIWQERAGGGAPLKKEAI